MKSIIVYSGKGGVGKTTTSANIAKTLAKQGKKVYVIDADINTPSMGVIFGNEHPTENIWVASTSFKYKNMIYLEKALVRSFLRDAIKHMNEVKPDYLIIDTPPSITDVHINLMEIVKVSAIVIVTQPNELSRNDVNRTSIFFTERCKNAGCIVIENMWRNEETVSYNWQLVERIPFIDNFDGAKALDLYPEKYENIVTILETMNTVDARMEFKKRMLFDESLTIDDLPYWKGDMRMDVPMNEMKFINLGTWEELRHRIMETQYGMIKVDQHLHEWTHERVARMMKAFEYDDEAYFLITKAPLTEIPLMPGEIGKGSFYITDSYYGIPRIKYQTRKGEVVLFPNEVMPADANEIALAIADGSTLTSDGRYIPAKEVLEQIWEAYGSRVGMTKNWEKQYYEILDQTKQEHKGKEPVQTPQTIKAQQRKKERNEYANRKH